MNESAAAQALSIILSLFRPPAFADVRGVFVMHSRLRLARNPGFHWKGTKVLWRTKIDLSLGKPTLAIRQDAHRLAARLGENLCPAHRGPHTDRLLARSGMI